VDELKTELEKFYGKNSLESKDLSRVMNAENNSSFTSVNNTTILDFISER